MKENIENRIAQLKSELESGQRMMLELEQQKARLQEQLLRISGAVQVLEELLAGAQAEADANVQPLRRSNA